MKKRKLLVKSSELSSWCPDGCVDIVSLMKHTQLKTGISMYSLDVNGVPVITCNSFVFLRELMNCCDFYVLLHILCYILSLRELNLANLESEE